MSRTPAQPQPQIPEDEIEKVLKSKALLIADLVGGGSERFRNLIEDSLENK